jgi:nucleotide-binding universal stress UspA family protein
MIERVVVGVDFSEASLAAATWVAQYFSRGSELVLVHALHVPPIPRFLEGRYPSAGQLVETARAGAEARLRQWSETVATGLIWPEIRVGAPDEVIVRVASEYDATVIVVGRPASRSGMWTRVGTTAQRVLRRSPVSVLLADGMPAREPARILVAVDESDMTDAVLRWGRVLAERFFAEATVLHVASVPTFLGVSSAGAASMSDEEESVVNDAQRWLAERLQDLAVGGGMTPTVVSGPVRPGEAIVAEAAHRRAELIVLGSRGAGAVPRLLFGSVAEKVLRDAACPVFVVPPGNAASDSSTVSDREVRAQHSQ